MNDELEQAKENLENVKKDLLSEKQKIDYSVSEEVQQLRSQISDQLSDEKERIAKEASELKDEIVNGFSGIGTDLSKGLSDAKDELVQEFDNAKANAEKMLKDGLKQGKEFLNMAKMEWGGLKANAGQLFGIIKQGAMDFDLKSTLSKAANSVAKDALKLMKDIAKDLLSELGKFLSSGQLQPSMQAPNRHIIIADVAECKLMKESGCHLEYIEIDNYKDANFPVRILKVTMPYKVAQKIQTYKCTPLRGYGLAMDLNLIILPIKGECFQLKPVQDGKFKAILKDNDVGTHLKMISNPSSEANIQEIGKPQTELVFHLYRENETRFQASDQINYILPNPTPSQVINKAFLDTCKGMKSCISKFENDQPMGKLILPHMSFTELVQLIDREVGLYRTPYYTFFEDGTYYLLNSDNKPNVQNENLQTSLQIEMRRVGGPILSRMFMKVNDKHFIASANPNDVSIEVKGSKSFQESIIYINPSGKRTEQDKSLTRETKVIRKTTEAAPLVRLSNSSYEEATVSLYGGFITKFTPVSNLILRDSRGNPRVYRISYKEIHVVSNLQTTATYKGFRLLGDEKQSKNISTLKNTK